MILASRLPLQYWTLPDPTIHHNNRAHIFTKHIPHTQKPLLSRKVIAYRICLQVCITHWVIDDQPALELATIVAWLGVNLAKIYPWS